jgi:hypothetical protein
MKRIGTMLSIPLAPDLAMLGEVGFLVGRSTPGRDPGVDATERTRGPQGDAHDSYSSHPRSEGEPAGSGPQGFVEGPGSAGSAPLTCSYFPTTNSSSWVRERNSVRSGPTHTISSTVATPWPSTGRRGSIVKHWPSSRGKKGVFP